MIFDNGIWKNNLKKVFGMREDFYTENPNTTVRIVKTMLRAAKWLDEKVIANSMTGFFEYEKGDKRDESNFDIFFRKNAIYPYYSDATLYLTQMRRWGQISERKSDSWYAEMVKKYIDQISMKLLLKSLL